MKPARTTKGQARVRWGNQRFWRVDEFATVAAACAFAASLRETHAEAPVTITVERLERRVPDIWISVDCPAATTSLTGADRRFP